jgi:hypothetical protein
MGEYHGDTVFISWEKLDRDFYIMDYLRYPATFKNVWPGYCISTCRK